MHSLIKRNVFTMTVVAAAQVEACRAVTATGNLPVVGGAMLGVSDFSAQVGDELNLDVLGTSILECSAAVDVDDLIQVSTADGRFAQKAAGKTVARALTSTTAAGQKFEALLLPANS